MDSKLRSDGNQRLDLSDLENLSLPLSSYLLDNALEPRTQSTSTRRYFGPWQVISVGLEVVAHDLNF